MITSADSRVAAAPGWPSIIKVVFAPSATYDEVAHRPRWAAALATTVIVAVVSSAILFSTDVGREALAAQQARSLELTGRQLSDADLQRIDRMLPFVAGVTAAAQLVTVPLMTLAVAGLVFTIFTVVLGRRSSFRQTFAIVSHSGVLLALRAVAVVPLQYLKGSLTSPTSLLVFAPFLDERTFAARLLGTTDLFFIWWVISLGIGVAVLYKLSTRVVAPCLLSAYGVVVVAIAAIRTALAG